MPDGEAIGGGALARPSICRAVEVQA